MKAEKLIGLICHPGHINSDDLTELETLVNRYPYFQSARVLYLKALHTSAPARFRNELKAGTVYITDHKQLYKYLHDLLEFDHSLPSVEKSSNPLSDLVSDRIREINGYISVNTPGIPANKEKNNTGEQRKREQLIEVNFSTSASAPLPVENPVQNPFFQTGSKDEPVISNPIVLDDIPGVINDYSDYEEQKQPRRQPVYETVEKHTSPDYIIEPVNETKEQPADSTTIPSESPGSSFISGMSIELIDEKEEGNREKKETVPHISLQELPEMLGAYQLEDDSPSGEEPSVSELAALLRKKKKQKAEKAKLIDKFITEEPTIPRGNLEEVEDRDLSEDSSTEKEDLFSETLAKIYIRQKLYEKAIATYIKLSLKYPEKSVYFANRIEKIKAKINNNE